MQFKVGGSINKNHRFIHYILINHQCVEQYVILRHEIITCFEFKYTYYRIWLLSTKLLSKGCIRNRLNTLLKVFCQLRTDDEKWHWQLHFGSKLIIVSLSCHTMVLCTMNQHRYYLHRTWTIEVTGIGHGFHICYNVKYSYLISTILFWQSRIKRSYNYPKPVFLIYMIYW